MNIKYKKTLQFIYLCFTLCILGSSKILAQQPVDYVNTTMGNISHLLVPTYPTIHLPHSMLRVYPERKDFVEDQIAGLPIIVTSHRGKSAFNISPFVGNEQDLAPIISYSWDNEILKPYYYRVFLDEYNITAEYAVSHQSAIYKFDFEDNEVPYLVFNTRDGEIITEGNKIYGYQSLENNTKVYLWAETNIMPSSTGKVIKGKGIDRTSKTAFGKDQAVGLAFKLGTNSVDVRYGVSFISIEQARKNVDREISEFNLEKAAKIGRSIWNEALAKIEVSGDDEDDIAVFYTSLYRCYERPVCISEDGQYFSAFDHQVHDDKGTPFYTDDWIWDTYRATHPLRILIAPQEESDIINSFLRMAEQMGTMWLPTFPEITGDSRRMNSNHGVATIADAWSKGLRTFDLEKAYKASRRGIEEKTLAPWSGAPSGWLDDFYKKNGYIPALRSNEVETVSEVSPKEKRQPIAVTLGTAYDEWCLSQIARFLGKNEESDFYAKKAYNYRNVYNPETSFFHPKDKEGNFIEPFDYRYSGGQLSLIHI